MLRRESRTTTLVLTSPEMILTSRNSSNLVPRVLSLLSQSSSFPGNEVVTEVAPSSNLPWRILRSHVKVSLAAYCQQKLFCAGHLFYYQDQNALSNAFLFKFFFSLGSKEIWLASQWRSLTAPQMQLPFTPALRVIFLGGEGWAISSKLLLFQQWLFQFVLLRALFEKTAPYLKFLCAVICISPHQTTEANTESSRKHS